MRTERTRRLFVAASSAALSLSVALLPLAAAGCAAQRAPRADEPRAVERLRALTHPEDLRPPADSLLAQIESEHADSRAGALARLARARLKFDAGDHAAAAALADSPAFARHTAVADQALMLRAEALAKSGRGADARAAFERLARDFASSPLTRAATLRAAESALQSGDAAAAVSLLQTLAAADDGDALLLTAKAHARQGDSAGARAAYRRAYFYAPATNAAGEAAAALGDAATARVAENAAEALARADRLHEAKLHAAAAEAYAQAFARFPDAADARARLRHGTSALAAKRYADAARALSAVPTSAGDVRVEALFQLAQAQARQSLWDAARASVAELRRGFPEHTLTKRAGTSVGTIAKELRNNAAANSFFREAVAAHPGAAEVAQAQFELAWSAHEARNFQESARLLVEHLASYADRNTDNRGRAGYWAARDSERAGRTADARALYEAMLQRYDANWYGHLARERLKKLPAPDASTPQAAEVLVGSPVARAVKNLSTVSVAEETVGPEADLTLRRADELNAAGFDSRALEELDALLADAPASPRLNLAKARVLRTSDRNVEALLALQKSFPDYAQMKPEEMTREQWDVFYPLEHWETITEQARARGLDPYRVASVIRQETVFSPRAESHANAYGLMQLLLETAQRTARRVGARVVASKTELFEPRLNITLGTAYLREQLDRYGRIEYAAAAYNAGPGRATQWKAELPAEIDEWTEAVPFRETRGYVQGIVRNTLQYQRLYDERGQFRPEVGTRPLRPHHATTTTTDAPADNGSRPRRVPAAAPDEPAGEDR